MESNSLLESELTLVICLTSKVGAFETVTEALLFILISWNILSRGSWLPWGPLTSQCHALDSTQALLSAEPTDPNHPVISSKIQICEWRNLSYSRQVHLPAEYNWISSVDVTQSRRVTKPRPNQILDWRFMGYIDVSF